ncbi:MAG: DUF84 family protein [Promethearchaeota archaeon]
MSSIICIGSLNKSKIDAVKNTVRRFEEYLGEPEIKLVEASKYAQPVNEQVRDGAKFRASKALEASLALKKVKYIYGVGIEGGLVKFQGTHFLTACCHVIRNDGESHESWSVFMECPDIITKKILEEGNELGPLISRLRRQKGWNWHGGTFGTLTGERYTRQDALEDALITCFSRFFIRLNSD